MLGRGARAWLSPRKVPASVRALRGLKTRVPPAHSIDGMTSTFLQHLIDRHAERAGCAFAVRLPGGDLQRAGAGEPAFTLAFRHESALVAAATRGHSPRTAPPAGPPPLPRLP